MSDEMTGALTPEEQPEGTDIPEVEEEIQVEPTEAETFEETEEPGEEIPEEIEDETPEEMVPKTVFEKSQQRMEKRIMKEIAKRKEIEEAFQNMGVSLDEKPQRPRRNQFKDDYEELNEDAFDEAIEAYEEKLFDWKEAQRTKTNIEKQAVTEQQAKLEQFHVAAEPLRAKYVDYDVMIGKEVFGKELSDVLVEDQLTEIAYYLGKNESEAIRLSQIAISNPMQLMRELGKLEAVVANSTKKSSGAPRPISPVAGDKGVLEVDSSKLSAEEWFAREEAKRKKKIEDEIGKFR